MDLHKTLHHHLYQQRMMQLATISAGKPWICTVYYVVDDQLNLYWLSLPERRHSRELVGEPHVAVTVPVKFDQPVIGIQAEGVANEIADTELIKVIMAAYVSKYDQGKSFYENFIAGKNQHRLYRFRPERYVLFDEVNSKGAPKELAV